MSKQLPNRPSKRTVSPLASRGSCLITGFDGFGGRKNNPSQLVVERMPQSLKTGKGKTIALETMVLETCEKSWTALKPRLASCSVLILTGVAAKRPVVSIERFALNIRDYRIEDNHGHQFQGSTIDKGGPEALTTGIDLLKLEKRLLAKGFPCEISNHAGTFVCNDIYYRALLHKASQGTPTIVLFVHLPTPGRYTRRLAADKRAAVRKKASALTTQAKQLDYMSKAVQDIAAYCCEHLI
jgi:pyroglutamyl-peptidase